MDTWMMVDLKHKKPPIVAHSREELAHKIGVNPKNISSAISHSKSRGGKSRYVHINGEKKKSGDSDGRC